MPGYFDYGFASRPVEKEKLRTEGITVWPDGLLREVCIFRWTFQDGTVRTCRVWQSYRPCKTGGIEFPTIPGRWAWTGERYTEPVKEPA